MLVYGSRSDWEQNVLAAGEETLEVDGESVDLVGAELITADEAFERFPTGSQTSTSAVEDRRVARDVPGG